jgi:hypothetical protein
MRAVWACQHQRCAAANVYGAVLKGNGSAEARKHLLLVYPEGLRSPGNRTGAFASLVLGVNGGLDLVTRVLQDRGIPADRRLGQRRSRGCQHHGQHRCQQHYFPQTNSSSLMPLFSLSKIENRSLLSYMLPFPHFPKITPMESDCDEFRMNRR